MRVRVGVRGGVKGLGLGLMGLGLGLRVRSAYPRLPRASARAAARAAPPPLRSICSARVGSLRESRSAAWVGVRGRGRGRVGTRFELGLGLGLG